MNTLTNELDRVALILKELTPATLTADRISSILKITNEIHIEELIGNYDSADEESDTQDEENDELSREKITLATRINKKADAVNDELDRIKKMRQTLNLQELDPLIQSVRRILHPVYNFTATLNK